MANLNSRKKYHFIYKTTCLITSKYYIGMHSTNKLDDGYKGSGKRLWYSINKHGLENHVTEILEFVNDRDSLVAREKEIVNEELITDQMCMNLMVGGIGGFISEEQQLRRARSANKALQEKLKTNPELAERFRQTARNNMLKLHAEGKIKYNTFECRTHSDETKRKMSETKHGTGIGSNNSQFGTMWITNGSENKKIKKDIEIPIGWYKGRTSL